MTMMDFEIQRFTRRCAATDRELQPGEWFYSALVSVGSDIVRRDYAAEAWNGPDEHTVGWWKSRVADAAVKKVQMAPSDVILNYFAELDSRPDKQDVRYVLALLMIRRRIVRLEDTVRGSQGEETLVLYCSRNEQEYRASVVMPATPGRVKEIQDELTRLLYADGN